MSYLMIKDSYDELKKKERVSTRILFLLIILVSIVITTLIFLIAQDF